MATSNRDRVGRIMDALRDGLGPFVVREYKMRYKGDKYLKAIDEALRTVAYQLDIDVLDNEELILKSVDTYGWLNLMWRRWKEVFESKLGQSERNYVSEMMTARNNWAHQKASTNDEAYRVADTAARLLRAVGAAQDAAVAEEIGRELLRLRFEEEAKKSKKTSGQLAPQEVTTMAGLKPWREVIQPHPDVTSGKYIPSDFAADLGQVISGKAEPEYQEPVEFFKRTYLTEGLLTMLVTGVLRLAAQGGDPVVQLKTSFGGGKTHSMLALYHLCSGKIKLSDFPGGERIAEHIGEIDLPQANRAVLVGTSLDPTRPQEYPDATVRTLWGELAYQIGGLEGYQLIEQADTKGVSPGANTLLELLDKFGPCLVVIDELVAYARNMYGVERLSAGTYDAVMTFVQNLTEAVKRSSDSMLLVSLPESDIERGGDAGRDTLEQLSHIVGRIEAVWKPVTATESFEIVRRRLFTQTVDYAARDAVLDAFSQMYRESSGEFPSGVGESDYKERMSAAYPIHPEMFDRLYLDWSTLDRFQRTRGVLRLMADIIRELWSRGDQSLLILPGTVPLDASRVRNEILRYLPDTWTAVFDRDIDGPESLPFTIDNNVPILGKYRAAQRVARTIFIGSAPSVQGQTARGLEEVRVRLACVQPGEQLAAFGDALRRMSNQLTYLYNDGSRFWYDTRPTVAKLARDRAQHFSEDDVNLHVIERLRKVPKNRDFAAFHIAPPETGDVADEARVRVVVLHPDASHKRANGETVAMQAAKMFLESRGTAQRLYKNMLVFIAPDETDVEALKQAAREFMAWQSIQSEEEQLNLDAQQRRQVRDSLGKADDTVNGRLREAYSWLLVPVQPEPMGPIDLQFNKISGDDNFYDRAARKLGQDGLLIYEWSPDNLRLELDNVKHPLWGEGGQVGLKQLWEYLAQYCYLPRLFDREVLIKAVQDGVIRLDAPFGYATGFSEKGHHTGLVFRSTGSVYFDDQSILLHPDSVVEPPPPLPLEGEDVKPLTSGKRGEQSDQPGLAKATTRYYGRTHIDAQRVNKEMGVIVDEVIQRLTSLVGCEVEITVEINAKIPEGFDETTVRTISENSRTLKFENFDFENE